MRIAYGFCLVALAALAAGSAWLAQPSRLQAQNTPPREIAQRRQIPPAAAAEDPGNQVPGDDQDEGGRGSTPRRTVSVTGEGEVHGAPDTAFVQVGVVTESTNAQTAVDANNQAMAQLLSVLKSQGIPETNIQTTSFNVSPQYRHDPQQTQTPRIVGYQVVNQVQVKVTDLDKLGRVLDAVVQVGANQIHGIQFAVDDDQELMDEALKQAMADARHKAELLAEAAGSAVGRAVEIRYGQPGGPIPMPRARAMMAEAMAQVPISPGQETLSARVEVVYELTD